MRVLGGGPTSGIALAVHFGRLLWTDEQIVGEASRREHHADNASACWMGGLTVARMCADSGVSPSAQVVRIRRRYRPLLLAVPPQSLSTERARRVLPDQYSRADAVANVQNSMLLLAAFTQGRPELLSAALEDRLHQPYRAALCPLLPALQQLKGKDGVLNAALSGAGPSVLIFLDPRFSVRKARERVAAHLSQAGLAAELIPTSITSRGALDYGASYVLLAILISVLGGISPSGGAGRIIGVVLAVLILQFLSTGLNLVFQSGGSNFLKEFAWGTTLLVVLAIGGRRYSRLGRASKGRGQTPRTVKAGSAVAP